MIQFEAELCRRCKSKLPKPVVREVIREVDTIFGPGCPVLPMGEYVRQIIIHALKNSSGCVSAAKALRIGKTTLYRRLIELEIDSSQYLERTRRRNRTNQPLLQHEHPISRMREVTLEGTKIWKTDEHRTN
jgi:hypothetical protein